MLAGSMGTRPGPASVRDTATILAAGPVQVGDQALVSVLTRGHQVTLPADVPIFQAPLQLHIRGGLALVGLVLGQLPGSNPAGQAQRRIVVTTFQSPLQRTAADPGPRHEPRDPLGLNGEHDGRALPGPVLASAQEEPSFACSCSQTGTRAGARAPGRGGNG